MGTMKTIKIALLGLTMLTGLSGAALAADAFVPADTYAQMGWYLRGDAGFSWINYDGDDGSGIAVGGGIGYQYSDNMRTDIRADWAGLGDDPSLATVTGNFYFDIPMDTVLTPYLGAGAGYGWASSRTQSHRPAQRRHWLPLSPDPVGRRSVGPSGIGGSALQVLRLDRETSVIGEGGCT
jgi:opacity protein-like surface antigen